MARTAPRGNYGRARSCFQHLSRKGCKAVGILQAAFASDAQPIDIASARQTTARLKIIEQALNLVIAVEAREFLAHLVR